MALQEVGQSTCGSSLGDPRYMKNDHFETKEAAVPDRRAELLDKVADYILSNGLADLSLRPLATAIDTSPRMLLYFFGSKERLIAEALAHIRIREQLDFKRAVSKSKPADRLESLLRDWRTSASPRREKYSRLFFEVYGLALQGPGRFPGFLERAVGDWLPLFAQAFAAAGVPPALARTLATLALGAVRGLHLDLLATGERKRTEAAFREMLKLFSLVVQSHQKLSGPEHFKDGSAKPASLSPKGATRNTR
jgi:AcrR family transcriptional regulator